MIRLKVKEILQEKHISQGKLSRMADISPATIARICNDPSYSPNLNTLEQIAKALQVKVQDLFEQQ